MSQAQEIFQGFKNLIFPNQKIEEIAEKRLKICFECPIRTDNKCDKNKSENNINGCGCFLNMKTRSPASKCPVNKW